MSQQVQDLIEKIKSEGIQTAEQKAREIEQEARKKAEVIVSEAQKRTEQMVIEARAEIARREKATQTALVQASRDMLLSLRKEIQNILQKIIAQRVHDSLTSENLIHIFNDLIQKTLENKSAGQDVLVSLNTHDLGKLKDGLIVKLQEQLKGHIKFQSSEDIGKGFTISFDAGKSSFDFTDVALAEYLTRFVNPQVASLIKEASLSR